MKKISIKRIDYIDSQLIDEQTAELANPQRIIAVGFVVFENREYITIARELVGKEYRGQLSIPRKSIIGIGQLAAIIEE